MFLAQKKLPANTILEAISKSITKCCQALGIEIAEETILMLADDILEVYRYESIEDVIYCLKKGRQGFYGFGHNKRGSLNMIVIRDWMALMLDEKASAREKKLAKEKTDIPEIVDVDYDRFKENWKLRKNKKSEGQREVDYHNYKQNYLNEKKEGDANPDL